MATVTSRPLEGRHILLGITGSIAAYKAAMLCRLLKREGAEVQVVMTALAKQFITPLTMATLSRRPILVEFFDPENGQWNSHVSLGEWADCYLIAPATANTLAKMAQGVADNLLLTTKCLPLSGFFFSVKWALSAATISSGSAMRPLPSNPLASSPEPGSTMPTPCAASSRRLRCVV